VSVQNRSGVWLYDVNRPEIYVRERGFVSPSSCGNGDVQQGPVSGQSYDTSASLGLVTPGAANCAYLVPNGL
jgi:hypothetical protein